MSQREITKPEAIAMFSHLFAAKNKKTGRECGG
jgi:hypothetical protein